MFLLLISAGLVFSFSCKKVPEGSYSSTSGDAITIEVCLEDTCAADSSRYSTAYTADTTPTFTFSYTRPQNVSYYLCSVTRQSSPTGSIMANQSCTSPMNIPTTLIDGVYKINVKAYSGSDVIAEKDFSFTVLTSTPSAASVTFGGYTNLDYTSTTTLPNFYTVGTSTSSWTIAGASGEATPAQMGTVVNSSTVAIATAVTNWTNFSTSINVTLPYSGSFYVHFFVRNAAGTSSAKRTVQVKFDNVPPDTTIFTGDNFLVSGITMKVDINSIRDQDYIQFGYINPNNPDEIIAIPNVCNDSTFGLNDCAFEFDEGGCSAGANLLHYDADFKRNCIDISDRATITSTTLATRIAAAVNRATTAATDYKQGLNATAGTPNPKAIHAYANRDTVTFIPSRHLASADAAYQLGNAFAVKVFNVLDRARINAGPQVALKLPDYFSTQVDLAGSVATYTADRKIRIVEVGNHDFKFSTTISETTIGSGVGSSTSSTIKIDATKDNIRSIGHKLAQAMNEYFQNTTNTSLKNRFRIYPTRTSSTTSSAEIRIYRTDGTNRPITVEVDAALAGTVTSHPTAAFNTIPDDSMPSTFTSPTVSESSYNSINKLTKFYHPFLGGQAFTDDQGTPVVLAQTPTFGPTSNSLQGSYNTSRFCESWGSVNISGFIEDGGTIASPDSTLEFKVQKVADESGTAIPSSNTCFNGFYDDQANMSSSCGIFQSMKPVLITDSTTTGSQVWNFSIPIPKCALAKGGSGTYRITARGKDLAGNIDATSTTLDFKWDTTSPTVAPSNFTAQTVANTNAIKLSWTPPTGQSVSGLKILILRRSKKCDDSTEKVFCDFETPKQGVLYQASATDFTLREIGGAQVAYVLDASTQTVTDINLAPVTTYYYRAFYVDAFGNYSFGYDTSREADSQLACAGSVVINDNFDRADSIVPGSPANAPAGLVWTEFDETLGGIVGTTGLNITHIFQKALRLQAIPSDVNTMAMAFMDVKPALVFPSTGTNGLPPSYEAWYVLTSEVPPTSLAPSAGSTSYDTGLELEVFSHIDVFNLSGGPNAGSMSMPLAKSLFHGNYDFGANNLHPEGDAAGSLARQYSSHIMGKFDVDTVSAASASDIFNNGTAPDTAHTNNWHAGLYYFSNDDPDTTAPANYRGFGVLESSAASQNGPWFRSFNPAGGAPAFVNMVPYCNNGTLGAACTASHDSNARFFYIVGIRVHTNVDALSNRTTTAPYNSRGTLPDGVDLTRFLYDDGNIVPDMQVSFIVKRYQVNDDGDFVTYTGAANANKQATGEIEVRTIPIAPSDNDLTNDIFRCLAFDPDPNNGTYGQALASATYATNQYCPPGTRFTDTGFTHADGLAEGINQSNFFRSIFSGTGTGIRARFRRGSESDTVPSVKIKQFKVCETTGGFLSDVEAWEDF